MSPTSLILRLPGDLPTAHPGHRDEKSKLPPCRDISQLDTPPYTSIFPRWFWVTLMWNTNSLSWLAIFPIWSACDPQEHVILFKKQEERGQVRKRKEQGGPLFFKNQMKRRQPYLFSGTGHTRSCGFITRLGSGCSTATGNRALWSDVLLASMVETGGARQCSMKQTHGNPMPRAPMLRASFVKAGRPHYALTTPRTTGGKPEPGAWGCLCSQHLEGACCLWAKQDSKYQPWKVAAEMGLVIPLSQAISE